MLSTAVACPTVKPGINPEKNEATNEKAEAMLMPRDAICTIAQMAVAQSKLFQYL